MDQPQIPLWLAWAREIQAIGQSGLTFSQDVFDRERYARLLAIASQIMETYTAIPETSFRELFNAQAGYATPKVDVRAAVFQDKRILLVQERSDGCWSMPGGWADINEPPAAMIEREVREESGYRVRARKVCGVFESNHDRQPLTFFHAYKILFLCELTGGSPADSSETSDARFFALDDLPPLSRNRTTPRHIHEAFAHLENGERPALFD